MSASIHKVDSSTPGAVGVEWADGKTALDHKQARQLAAEYDPNSPEERRLVRKLDWRLVVSLFGFQEFCHDPLLRPQC